MANWFDIQLQDSISNCENVDQKSADFISQQDDFILQSKVDFSLSELPSDFSPNEFLSIRDNQLDIDNKTINSHNVEVNLMIEKLLNEIYCNLKSNRSRGYSISSDSSYSTIEFQSKPPLRKTFLKAKGYI